MVMFYSMLLGVTLPACALKQGLICFTLCRTKQTLTIGPLVSICSFQHKLNFVSIQVLVVRQHCTQIEGFAFSHIIINVPSVLKIL